MCVYLRTKFPVSMIILTRFRQGGGGVILTPQPQNELLKSPPRLALSLTLKLTKLASYSDKGYI